MKLSTTSSEAFAFFLLSAKRHKKCKTQFAKYCGIDIKTIWNWENNRTPPSQKALRKIEKMNYMLEHKK